MAAIGYKLHQYLSSAWAKRRRRKNFDQVSVFCLFIGYPRSGHSLVGALINAHRDAVIAHELGLPSLILAGCDRDTLYSKILARAAWFNLRGNTSNYTYQVPGQWQGRFEALRVIGDKRGGAATLALGQYPDLLKTIRATVGVPVRLIHVVRNPFDNIAAISLWHRLSLNESIDYYFLHGQTTGRLDAFADPRDIMTIHHEAMVRSPEDTLEAVCLFLGLEPDARYLADCSSIVLPAPTHTRRRVDWSAAQVMDVERRAARHPFLQGYTFEIGEEQAPAARSVKPAAPMQALWPSLVRRFRPTERPAAGTGLGARISPGSRHRETGGRG